VKAGGQSKVDDKVVLELQLDQSDKLECVDRFCYSGDMISAGRQHRGGLKNQSTPCTGEVQAAGTNFGSEEIFSEN
jgi:hypothetical protein